ncbi:MAG TPA: universal stress protein [Stellaceae bacterium]|nr:universal stress protein [Stellaceae bacterium]HMD65165.1 universal stress protein [Stellaceae bacterium]
MYTRILAANDGSPGGRKALAGAIELARKVSAELHMVTVEELPRFPASIDEIAEEKDEANHRFAPVIDAANAEAKAAGVAIETHLVPGHVADAVIGLIEQLKADLLVVGFMGHSQLYERIIGGTTDRLVRLAPCAVLVVK